MLYTSYQPGDDEYDNYDDEYEGRTDDNYNKLASLEATLVRNYDPLTYPLTDRGKV